jgi:hypothetical protein
VSLCAAPLSRHLQYDITGVNFTYTTDLGGQADIDMGGKLSANTFGLHLGAQFNLGKNLILDWWIIGPHYGNFEWGFCSVTDRTLSLLLSKQNFKKS